MTGGVYPIDGGALLQGPLPAAPLSHSPSPDTPGNPGSVSP